MKKSSNKALTRLLTVAGILLIVAAAATVAVTQLNAHRAARHTGELVSGIRALMPPVHDGVPDDRIDLSMPIVEVDGTNFVGILELPAYETVLPVHGTWDKETVTRYPCRYTGTMYDGSLVIGGSDNEGQLDFMKQITGGDTVYMTDVTGLRYTYVVTEVEQTDDVSTRRLTGGEADLVLFARNTYSLDHTVVRCRLKSLGAAQ